MRKLLLVFAAAALSLALIVSPGVAANDTRCVGVLPPGVYDNVVVPPGRFCVAFGSTIRGNVTIGEAAFLDSFVNRITGDVQGERGSVMNSNGDHVGGNVELRGVIAMNGGNVGGNLKAKEGVLAFTDSTIGGDVVAENSDVSIARIGVGSTVGGDLQVGENRPDAIVNVSICGVTLPHGNFRVEKVRGQITIGDPAGGPFCGGGNVVMDGNLEVVDTMVINRLEIHDSFVARNLEVVHNTGDGPKTVETNTVGDTLRCFENEQPFVGGPNTAPKKEGQCI